MKIYLGLCALIATSVCADIGRVARRWGSQVTPVLSNDKPVVSPQLKTRQYYHIGSTPNWDNAHHFSSYRGIRYAHFELNAVDVDGENIATTFYIATQAQRARKTYTLKVVITQKARGSVVRVFDADGMQVAGEVPIVAHADETRRAPLLPWRDGMAQFYSVLLQKIEGKPHLVIVQHTRNKVLKDGQFYRPGTVADILKRYATHSLLAERPFGYLDEVAHMRVLPVPYVHDAYSFPLSQELFLTWSVEQGTIKIHPRNS